MTEEERRRDEVERGLRMLLAKATKSPLLVSYQHTPGERHEFTMDAFEGSVLIAHWEASYDTPCFDRGQADAWLFARVTQDLPRLLDENVQLRAEVTKMRTLLAHAWQDHVEHGDAGLCHCYTCEQARDEVSGEEAERLWRSQV